MSNGEDDFGDLAPSDPKISADNKAEREAAGFAFGFDLSRAKDIAALHAIGRREALNNTLSRTIRAFIILAAGLVAISGTVLIWHFIGPDYWLFLSDARVEKLKDFLFSGTVGAALAQLAKDKLGKDSEK